MISFIILITGLCLKQNKTKQPVYLANYMETYIFLGMVELYLFRQAW